MQQVRATEGSIVGANPFRMGGQLGGRPISGPGAPFAPLTSALIGRCGNASVCREIQLILDFDSSQ